MLAAKRNLLTVALLVSCVLLWPAVARADTITTFNVDGRFQSSLYPAPGSFSGTLGVDTTVGRVISAEIFFPHLVFFNRLKTSEPIMPPGKSNVYWQIQVFNEPSLGGHETLFLLFSTSPTAGSLVGFSFGRIENVNLDGSFVIRSSVTAPIYDRLSGTITPALSTSVPEPSSLTLLALGLTFGFARKRARNG